MKPIYRRRVLIGMAALLACASRPAFAQPARVYRVGILDVRPADENRANLDALLRGLRELGYSEGRNLVIDYRSADGRSDRSGQLARDLVRAKPDVIITRGTQAALAARDGGSVPVVMAAVADPVAAKVVASLARPGGHVTGLTTIVDELHAKRLELIKQLIPTVKAIGYFANPTNPNTQRQWQEIERRALSLGLQPQLFQAGNAETLQLALKAAVAARIGALLLNNEAVIAANGKSIIDFAARNKLPVMYSGREFVESGGLVSYGVHYPELYYRAASYIDKILKGANAGDLPIERPTKFELVISLRAAKALGLTIPKEVLLRADAVVE